VVFEQGHRINSFRQVAFINTQVKQPYQLSTLQYLH